jgi:DnaJ domain/TPR repeat/WD domain, G-beta repeat
VAERDRYYEILEIAPGATPQAVKQAYRLLARKWHPDRFTDTEEKAIAEAKFKQINLAYAALKDYEPTITAAPAQRPPTAPAPHRAPGIPTDGKSPQVLYQTAADYAQHGQYESAIACLSAAIAQSPDYAMAYRYRGHLRSLLALERSATADLQTADDLDRTMPSPPTVGPAAMPPDATSVLPIATTIAQQLGPVTAIASRSDVGWVVVGNRAGTLTLWDLAGNRSLGSETIAHAGQVTGLVAIARWGQGGRLMVSAGADGQLKCWRLHSGRWGRRRGLDCRQTVKAHPGAVTAIAVAAQRLVTAGTDGCVKYWQISGRGQLTGIEQIPAHQGAVRTVALSPNGDLLVSGGEDGMTYLWRLSMHVCLGSLPHKAGMATAAAFSPDGQCVAIGEASGWVQILRVTGEPGQITIAQVLPAHAGAVRSIQWLPDQRLLTLGDDRVIRVWASGSNQPQAATIAFEQPILSLTSIDDAQTCLVGSATGQLIRQEM